MIALADAQRRLLGLVSPLPVEQVPLLAAAGRWLAEPLIAKRTQPARALSAMDGYAIAHGDGGGPWRVVGSSAAGQPFLGSAGRMEAVRIFTGAIVPDGCDSIVIQENGARDGEMLTLNPDINIGKWQHIRAEGSDFSDGDILIARGEIVTAAAIGLAAMAGYATLPVRKRPRIAIFSTGNELVAAGQETSVQQIPSSNAPMIAALLAKTGADVQDLGIIPDDLAAIKSALTRVRADIVVTIGGASVGDHDLVRPALLQCGAQIDFWKGARVSGRSWQPAAAIFCRGPSLSNNALRQIL